MSVLNRLMACTLLLTLQGCASHAFPTKYGVDDRHFGELNVDDFTPSKQYAVSIAHLNAPPETVFAKVADHRNLRDWVPMIKHLVEVDHSHSSTPGHSDVGTFRTCEFGGDTLVEDIRYWKEGVGYAYSVREGRGVAVKDHLGVFWLESDGKNGTYLTWRQYFEKKPWSIKAQVMPIMMSFAMNSAMKNLTTEWGGEVL